MQKVREEMPIEGKKYVKFDKAIADILVGKQIPLSTRKEIERTCQRIVSFKPNPQAVLEQFFSKDFLGKEGERQFTYEDVQEWYKDESLFVGSTYAWTTLRMEATENQVGVFGVFAMLDNPRPGEEFSYKHLSGQHRWRKKPGKFVIASCLLHRPIRTRSSTAKGIWLILDVILFD